MDWLERWLVNSENIIQKNKIYLFSRDSRKSKYLNYSDWRIKNHTNDLRKVEW